MSADTDLVVSVPLGQRSYEVCVSAGNVQALGPFARQALSRTWAGQSCRRGLIVTDDNMAPFAKPYADSLRASGIATTVAVIPAGEASKSLEQSSELYDRLIELRADRHFAIVAMGGGVVGDLAGFVAATFVRGLPLIMVPTTLLSQVDSSVGGKVGVNHPRVKNIIGAFHQPVGVWIDVNSLLTLSGRELRCGLAEVVKYGVILDRDFFAFLESNADAVLANEPKVLRNIVARCCELKAGVVSADEREETGLRAILNFGHTIAHAIEAVAGYDGPYKHGEAVSVGMVAESRLAESVFGTHPQVTLRIERLLKRFGLPTTAPGLDRAAMIAAMSRDKKNRDGSLRFVLPRSVGQVEMTEVTARDAVNHVLDQMETPE